MRMLYQIIVATVEFPDSNCSWYHFSSIALPQTALASYDWMLPHLVRRMECKGKCIMNASFIIMLKIGLLDWTSLLLCCANFARVKSYKTLHNWVGGHALAGS